MCHPPCELVSLSLNYGLFLPQGFLLELAGITDPVEAYETLTWVAQTAAAFGWAPRGWMAHPAFERSE